MKPFTRPLPFLVLLAAAFGLAAVTGVGAPAFGEEPERPKLEAHPMADCKPGEYLRFMTESDGWKRYFVERILDVKDGKVLWEVVQTSEDGTEDKSIVERRWKKIPKLKPNRRQTVVKDGMVWLEVGDKKLWCRHFTINEREHPDWEEPKRRKEVWYTNDILCSGKAKDSLAGRIVTSWGMMSPEETQKRRKAYEDSKKGRQPNPNR